jgi:hypothetical protein
LVRNQKHPLPGEKARERGVTTDRIRGKASWVTALCNVYKAMRNGRNPDLFKGKRGEKEFEQRVGGIAGFWPGGPRFVDGHKRRAEHKTIPVCRLNVLGDLHRVYPDQMPRSLEGSVQVFTEEEVGPIRPFIPLAQDGGDVFPRNLPAAFEEQDEKYVKMSETNMKERVREELARELTALRERVGRPATPDERKKKETDVAGMFDRTVREVRQWTMGIRS